MACRGLLCATWQACALKLQRFNIGRFKGFFSRTLQLHSFTHIFLLVPFTFYIFKTFITWTFIFIGNDEIKNVCLHLCQVPLPFPFPMMTLTSICHGNNITCFIFVLLHLEKTDVWGGVAVDGASRPHSKKCQQLRLLFVRCCFFIYQQKNND